MDTHIVSVLSKMQKLNTSDHASVVSMNLFVALLCACIVIGHLLEENRWMNESITALLIVRFSLSDLFFFLFPFLKLFDCLEILIMNKSSLVNLTSPVCLYVYLWFIMRLAHHIEMFDVVWIVGRAYALGLLFCLLVAEEARIF